MHLAKNNISLEFEFDIKYWLKMICRYQRKSYLYANKTEYVQTICKECCQHIVLYIWVNSQTHA